MQAIADTSRLVADGIITSEQARTIESRAREVMVDIAVNAILSLGIAAATGGFVLWLGTPASVAIVGLLFLGMGSVILVFGSERYGMFGNASALIGAGMLIGGASLELMETYTDIAGTVMTASGFIVATAGAWLLNVERESTRFVTGAILLMGLAMHLFGIAFLLERADASGAPMMAFYMYASLVIVVAGWLTDVRLVTALAIFPFAQALDTGTFYFDAVYVFSSPEPTLSIIQMSVLVFLCVWIAAHRPERTARHALVLAVMAFIVANLCALVGSLWGDFVGDTIWVSGPPSAWSDEAYYEWLDARDAFRETALYLSSNLYSVLWAVALAALILWSAHKALRGLFNASLTFAGIHAYTQLFESFSAEPLAFVIGGIAAIPLAWSMWRLDHWIVAKRGIAATV